MSVDPRYIEADQNEGTITHVG